MQPKYNSIYAGWKFQIMRVGQPKNLNHGAANIDWIFPDTMHSSMN